MIIVFWVLLAFVGYKVFVYVYQHHQRVKETNEALVWLFSKTVPELLGSSYPKEGIRPETFGLIRDREGNLTFPLSWPTWAKTTSANLKKLLAQDACVENLCERRDAYVNEIIFGYLATICFFRATGKVCRMTDVVGRPIDISPSELATNWFPVDANGNRLN